MVLFDGFINEKLPSDDINHIHHQWSPCFYNSLFYAFDDALAVMKEQPMDQNRMAQMLMTVFGIGRRESISDQRNFGSQQEHYAISLDRILSFHLKIRRNRLCLASSRHLLCLPRGARNPSGLKRYAAIRPAQQIPRKAHDSGRSFDG